MATKEAGRWMKQKWNSKNRHTHITDLVWDICDILSHHLMDELFNKLCREKRKAGILPQMTS